LTPEQIEIADSAIMEIATRYTREAGVRQLERNIAALAGKSRSKSPRADRKSRRGWRGH
jgi:ATP-dependent Lon protease